MNKKSSIKNEIICYDDVKTITREKRRLKKANMSP